MNYGPIFERHDMKKASCMTLSLGNLFHDAIVSTCIAGVKLLYARGWVVVIRLIDRLLLGQVNKEKRETKFLGAKLKDYICPTY